MSYLSDNLRQGLCNNVDDERIIISNLARWVMQRVMLRWPQMWVVGVAQNISEPEQLIAHITSILWLHQKEPLNAKQGAKAMSRENRHEIPAKTLVVYVNAHLLYYMTKQVFHSRSL